MFESRHDNLFAHRKSATGFPSVELLSVIAVTALSIAPLFAWLVPAAEPALQAVRRSHCASSVDSIRYEMNPVVHRLLSDWQDGRSLDPQSVSQWKGLQSDEPRRFPSLRGLPPASESFGTRSLLSKRNQCCACVRV
jgi:hypothetical protein